MTLQCTESGLDYFQERITARNNQFVSSLSILETISEATVP
ncbi:MAG TPA: hypothetical protein V6D33_14905 [Cyanophyceae cyanobacterium]